MALAEEDLLIEFLNGLFNLFVNSNTMVSINMPLFKEKQEMEKARGTDLFTEVNIALFYLTPRSLSGP
jgi:hypothetical protein